MPQTAKKHFDEDTLRAEAILAHAQALPAASASKKLLQADCFRSSWMYVVGAMDAYFCDAYADIVARILKAKSIQNSLRLTSKVERLSFPVGVIFAKTNVRENWKWRLAARDLTEKDNVLSISKIRDLFNPFLRKEHKLFNDSVVKEWILIEHAPKRLVGISSTDFRGLTGSARKSAIARARKKIEKRYGEICQRRHDCIHNCDRPKLALQRITHGTVDMAIKDVKRLVVYYDAHFESEFNHYLVSVGADALTKNRAGY